MKFECPSCKKSGQVDDSKIPEVGVYANCPQCNSKFLIKREEPKGFVFEAVEQPTVETKQKKPMGKIAMFFIAFGITIAVNLAVHIPFIAINGFKMHMGPLSMVNIIAMIAAYICLTKKRLHALTIVSAIIGIIFIVALDIPSSGSRSSIKVDNYSKNNSLKFVVQDDCDDGISIQYRFFDVTNNLWWPSSDKVYKTSQYQVENTHELSCLDNANICFGATPYTVSPTVFWGLGINNDQITNIATSCVSCGSVPEKQLNFSCPN
jgi:predicted Zn finger-like uncharacterized protein